MEGDDAPVAVEKVPAAHRSHADAPLSTANEPCAHDEHAVAY